MQKKHSAGFYFLWVSLGSNLVLFCLKIFAGLKSNSIAMLADSLDTLSDTVTSSIVFFGYWVASQPPDKQHPFGHGRSESITAIIIATIISIAGLKILYESISGFFTHRVFNFGYFEIAIFIFAVIVKMLLYINGYRLGKKNKSQALIADALHHRSDASTTLLVVISAFVSKYYWWLDSTLGIVVSGLIIYSAYEIMRSSISILLGETPEDEVIEKIKNIVSSVNKDIKDLHEIKLHHYGQHQELTMHITLPPKMTVEEAYKIIEQAEEKIFEGMQIKATLHIEPHQY